MHQEELENQYDNEYLSSIDKGEYRVVNTNLKYDRNISQFTKEIVTPIFKSGKVYKSWVYDKDMSDIIKSFAIRLLKEINKWKMNKPEKNLLYV
jgi:hypothetical protein